jgi:hypothetical protein
MFSFWGEGITKEFTLNTLLSSRLPTMLGSITCAALLLACKLRF